MGGVEYIDQTSIMPSVAIITQGRRHRGEERFASFNYLRPSSVGGSKSTVPDARESIFLELRYKIEC
jgi:hypothetical protein